MGVDFVSAAQISSQNYSVRYQSGREVTSSISSDWGTGFNVIHNGHGAFYSHNDYTRSTSRIIDLVRKITKNPQPTEFDPEKIGGGNTTSIQNTQNLPFQSNDEFELFLKDIHRELEGKATHYAVNGNLSYEKRTIQNSEFSRIIQSNCNTLIDVTLSNGDTQLVITAGGIDKSDIDYTKLVREIDESISKLGKMELPTKKMPTNSPCVLSSDATFSLVHEAIGHAVEADTVINNASYLSHRIGYKVASSQVTVTDDPHLRGIGYSEYDDEATKTKGTLIVEDGILMDFLQSRKTAANLNAIPTGNARVSSYLYPPEPRQSNLFIEPKDHSFEELLEEVKDGIYIGPTLLASTSIYSGELQIQPQYSQEIVDGQLGAYLKPKTISGNSLVLLNDISAIGKDISKFPTECLKSQSRVLIGAYSPQVALKSAQFI
jgi:TldD protein